MIRVLAYGMSLLFYHRQVCGHTRGPKINVLNPDCQGPGRLRRPLLLPIAPPSNTNSQRIGALPADRPRFAESLRSLCRDVSLTSQVVRFY
jgi:hypothetical protein